MPNRDSFFLYKDFTRDDVVTANQSIITTGLWSGDLGGLEEETMFFLNNQIQSSGEYYFDVYNNDPDDNQSAVSEVQFAIAYGHINGAGAPTLQDNETATLPTKAIYSQYRNLLLNPDQTKFTFGGVESDHIYVINVGRARIREQLDPGNWELPLSGGRDYGIPGFIHTFIDNSNDTFGEVTGIGRGGRVYKVISGSFTGPEGVVTASVDSDSFEGKGYGYVYPDLGIIVLNPDAIGPAVGFFAQVGLKDGIRSIERTGSANVGSFLADDRAAYTLTNVLDFAPASFETFPFAPFTGSAPAQFWDASSKSAYNQAGLFIAIKNAIVQPDGSATALEFRARSAETISSTHYFVRLRNKDYNYSNNPTFRDTNNILRWPEFKKDPKVYITTIGLYNDNNELLAVAKLSKPVRKSYSEEVLLRVRLDF
jgi:hypothetical protein